MAEYTFDVCKNQLKGMVYNWIIYTIGLNYWIYKHGLQIISQAFRLHINYLNMFNFKWIYHLL